MRNAENHEREVFPTPKDQTTLQVVILMYCCATPLTKTGQLRDSRTPLVLEVGRVELRRNVINLETIDYSTVIAATKNQNLLRYSLGGSKLGFRIDSEDAITVVAY